MIRHFIPFTAVLWAAAFPLAGQEAPLVKAEIRMLAFTPDLKQKEVYAQDPAAAATAASVLPSAEACAKAVMPASRLAAPVKASLSPASTVVPVPACSNVPAPLIVWLAALLLGLLSLGSGMRALRR